MKVIELHALRDELEKGVRKEIRGVEYIVGVSPFYFPERLECNYDDTKGCLVIDFKYLNEEDAVLSERSDHLAEVYEGKHSGKLLSVHIHVDKHDFGAVRLTVVEKAAEAIERIHPRNPSASDSFGVGARALRSKRPEIEELLVG